MAESGEELFSVEREFTESELNHAFAAANSTDDLWIAVRQLLKDHIVRAMDDVSDPETAMNHGSLSHAAGGLEYLGQFQKELVERFSSAHSSNSPL